MDYGAKRLAALILVLLILLGFAGVISLTGTHVTSIRREANREFVTVQEKDLPEQILSSPDGRRANSIRRPVNLQPLNPAFTEALRFIKDSPYIVAMAEGNERKPARVLAPILQHEGSGLAALSAPLALEFGETLDEYGKPLRWHVPENVLAAYNVPRQLPFGKPESSAKPAVNRSLSKLAPSQRAANYRALVDSFAKRYNLSSNLVMAIIHSESNFSPGLVSNKSAMGLMQLLPSTASDEVHRFLYGRRGQINFEQLSVPEINIRYGTAYLHILNNRYFADVKDAGIREACVIASYNMGPNGFLRLYGTTPGQAIEKINRMTPAEFHADLPRRLPVRETRFYVEKVRRMKQHYAGMP